MLAKQSQVLAIGSPPLAKLRLHKQRFASIGDRSPRMAKGSPLVNDPEMFWSARPNAFANASEAFTSAGNWFASIGKHSLVRAKGSSLGPTPRRFGRPGQMIAQNEACLVSFESFRKMLSNDTRALRARLKIQSNASFPSPAANEPSPMLSKRLPVLAKQSPALAINSPPLAKPGYQRAFANAIEAFGNAGEAIASAGDQFTSSGKGSPVRAKGFPCGRPRDV
ncbi:hypothetical protein R1flu_021674 [Riccia fluitans]|uniref:Uncharacterized protein n=1 Tax=Riccia fluitans TaxID=41844 RepID=A0ABD1ZRV5_9MARC